MPEISKNSHPRDSNNTKQGSSNIGINIGSNTSNNLINSNVRQRHDVNTDIFSCQMNKWIWPPPVSLPESYIHIYDPSHDGNCLFASSLHSSGKPSTTADCRNLRTEIGHYMLTHPDEIIPEHANQTITQIAIEISQMIINHFCHFP